MNKIYGTNNGTGNEYTIRQAAAGNWCLDIRPYGEKEYTYCFNTEAEAYEEMLNLEGGVHPTQYEDEDEEV